MFKQKPDSKLFILWFLIWGLSACSSAVKPTKMDGTITISNSVNPDHTGRPSPVIVRLYQLRNSGIFTGADFFTLYDDESSLLSADLISREEYNLLPGEVKSINPLLDPETHYIGVVAAFRDIEASTWRAISILPEKKFYNFGSPVINVFLEENSISVKVK